MNCLICYREFICDSNRSISNHFRSHKITSKEYYDKFFKKDDKECICRYCGKATMFASLKLGYHVFCSITCGLKNTHREDPDRRIKSLDHLMKYSATKEHAESASKRMKNNWQDKEWRNTTITKIRESVKTLHKTDVYGVEWHLKLSEGNRRSWANKETREKRETGLFKYFFSDQFKNLNNGYKTGYYFSKKNDCKIYYASSYELQAFEILELLDDVKCFSRCKFSIDYISPKDNKIRRYIPDIEVLYNSGRRRIIEIKPKSLLNNEINKAKFAAGRAMFGNNFEVWTEKDLN